MAFYKNLDKLVECRAYELSGSDSFYLTITGNPAIYKVESFTIDGNIVIANKSTGRTKEISTDLKVYRRRNRLVDIDWDNLNGCDGKNLLPEQLQEDPGNNK